MKKFLFAIIAAVACTLPLNAQKIAYINTDEILKTLPEYTDAQSQLNTLNDKYQALIEAEYGKIETLYQNYQSKKNSMSAAQRTESENEIIAKEKVVKEKQKIYFGEDGVMAKKSQELMSPIKDKVDKAIAATAKLQGYDLVLDLAAIQGVVYKNNSFDITQLVIARLLAN